jgi:hypothetical protein
MTEGESRLHHCWHEATDYKICCCCDKRTKRNVRNYFTKDGLVEITCNLSKKSLMWAEGYRK